MNIFDNLKVYGRKNPNYINGDYCPTEIGIFEVHDCRSFVNTETGEIFDFDDMVANFDKLEEAKEYIKKTFNLEGLEFWEGDDRICFGIPNIEYDGYIIEL